MKPRKQLKNTFHIVMGDGLGIGKNAREGFEEVTSELTLWKLSKGQDGILDKRIRMLCESEFTLG